MKANNNVDVRALSRLSNSGCSPKRKQCWSPNFLISVLISRGFELSKRLFFILFTLAFKCTNKEWHLGSNKD